MPWSPPPLPALTPSDPALLPFASALAQEPGDPARDEAALRALLPDPAARAGLRSLLAWGLDAHLSPASDPALAPAERHRPAQAAHRRLARLRRVARALLDQADPEAEALLAARLGSPQPEVAALCEEVLLGWEPGGFTARAAGRAALEAVAARGPGARSGPGPSAWVRALLLLDPERALAELRGRPDPALARAAAQALPPQAWLDGRWGEALAGQLCGAEPAQLEWLLAPLCAAPASAARALQVPMAREAFDRLLAAVLGSGDARLAGVLERLLPGVPERRSKRDGRKRSEVEGVMRLLRR